MQQLGGDISANQTRWGERGSSGSESPKAHHLVQNRKGGEGLAEVERDNRSSWGSHF